MHIGLSRPKAPPFPIADVDAAVVAQFAEAAGFEHILFGEHTITPTDEGLGFSVHAEGVPHFQEPLVALARISAATRRIRFGFGILILPQHHPVRLAKQLACLDHYGGGRLMLGIGVGWSRAETEALGGRFERRWAQAREAVGLMRVLWTQDRVEHHGEFFEVPPVRCFPRPAQPGGPPVLIGAGGERALQRVVGYGDGWMPAFVTPEAIAAGPETIRAGRRRLDALAAQAGRGAVEFTITAILRGEVSRDLLARYAEAGVARAAITLSYYETEATAREAVERMAEQVL